MMHGNPNIKWVSFVDPKTIDLSLGLIYVGRVSRMGNARYKYRILVRTPARKGHLVKLVIDGWIILTK